MFLLVLVAFALLLQLILFRIFGSLCVRGFPFGLFMVLPGISPVFCFMGFVLFLRFRLSWFISFFCRRLFSICMHSFCLVWFFLRREPLSGSLFSSSSGPPLGGCVLLLGFCLVCPPLVSLAMSPSATVLQAVFFRGFLFHFFLSPFSSVTRSPSVVRYGSCLVPSPSSHGVLCCWLPFRVVSHLVFLSGAFGVRDSSSSSFVVSVPGGGLLPPVTLLACTVRALPLFLLVWFFFPLVLVVFSFLLVLLLVLFLLLPSFIRSAFFADTSSCSSGSSLLQSPLPPLILWLPLFVLVPQFVFRGFWGVASSWAFPVPLLCLLFWEDSLWSSSSVFPSFCLFFRPFSSSSFLPFGVLCWLRLPGCSLPSFI